MKRTLTQLGFAVTAALAASGAGATLHTWNLDYGTIGGSTFTQSSNGVTLTAKAYSTNYSGTTFSTRNASSWIGATFGDYSPSGVGIMNTNEDGTSPNHSIDNGGRVDVIVMEATTAVDWTSLLIGWNNSNPNTNIQAWTSNTLGAGYNFLNACFSGTCSTGGTGNNLSSLGFSSAGNFSNVATGVAQNLTDGTMTSRYLIVAGNLSQTDDAFKLRTITATSRVPEPAPIALLGLGLLGFVLARKRRSV